MTPNWHPDCERARALLLQLSRKDETTGCRLWTGYLDAQGYGCVGQQVFKGESRKAHRIAWMVENGPIPKGLFALHKCDNRACIEEDHLYLGTLVDNKMDQLKRSPTGLTPEQVLAIRADTRPCRAIAQEYKIGPAAIHHIRAGRTWSWLTDKGTTP